jgi:spore coat polysaccharide biosynthesis protein SpsF
MHTRPGVILQARFASLRLPGKALAMIGSRSVLEHCLRRLLAGRGAEVVLATTTNPEDDQLEAVAVRLGVAVFRGEVDDVLGRYAEAASRYRLDPIIRATADNPAVDIDGPGRLLEALRDSGADYVREDGLPIGAAVEGITYAALRRAAMAARLPYDREHVTTFVKKTVHGFRLHCRPAPAALYRPDLRLTVDTPADLDQLQALFARASTDLPSLARLIDLAGPRIGQEVA